MSHNLLMNFSTKLLHIHSLKKKVHNSLRYEISNLQTQDQNLPTIGIYDHL